MSELRLFTHQPLEPLRRYVREMLWVRSEQPRTQILMPETNLTLVLRQSGHASLHQQTLPHAVVSGLQQETRIIRHAAHSLLLIVRFTEAGSPAVLHDRADLLYNRTQALDQVLARAEVEDIQNVLADTHGIEQQFLAVEHFLLRQIQRQTAISSRGISPQIEAATKMIRNSEGRASIAAIARRAGMSQSALERHFRAAVGASPKTLSRLARLQYVCRLWDAGKSLTEITFEAGYFDQPHMVRDFRLFTGKAPEEFFRGPARRNLPTFYK
ncbi:MAG TPA: helix-turn-helix domain-containing protein [Silvibacterium sp.]|nr:helix-turn-helix domain-containing protein [Silvibacterium sp.]